MAEIALITGISCQNGSYLGEVLLEKGREVHRIKQRASSFNTTRIDSLCSRLTQARAEFGSALLHQKTSWEA